jgi:hypothetical protein
MIAVRDEGMNDCIYPPGSHTTHLHIVAFDNPTFGQCSINHQYCDLLQNAFHETIYLANGECDKEKAFYVQDQSFDANKCYGGDSGQSVILDCTAGACPSTTASTSDHRALFLTQTLLAGMLGVPKEVE